MRKSIVCWQVFRYGLVDFLEYPLKFAILEDKKSKGLSGADLLLINLKAVIKSPLCWPTGSITWRLSHGSVQQFLSLG